MKNPAFWDITPSYALKINRYFGGTFHFHLHGRGKSQAVNQYESK
jgi:hypothetical protein